MRHGAYFTYVSTEYSEGNNATDDFNKQLFDDLSYNA